MSSLTLTGRVRGLGGDLLLGSCDELVVHGVVLVLGPLYEVLAGVVAEDEAHPVIVPTVELGRERVVGVAAQTDLFEPGLSAQFDGPVEVLDHAFVTGPVGAVLGQIKGFFGVGERDHQGGVAPDAAVGDVHTFFRLAIGGYEAGVGVDDRRTLEERIGLALPHLEAGRVYRILEGEDRALVEAPAEVPGGGRVREALGPESVEEHRVASAQFDVLEPLSPAQGVVRDVEHMVGLEIGLVQLEEAERGVDLFGQADG